MSVLWNQNLGLGTAYAKEKRNIDEGLPCYDGLHCGDEARNKNGAKRITQRRDDAMNDGAQRPEKRQRRG